MAQPNELLTCYDQALRQVGPMSVQAVRGRKRREGLTSSPEASRTWLAQAREELVVAHEVISTLLISNVVLKGGMTWSDLTQAISCLYWVDQCAASDEVGVTHKWTTDVIQHFETIFTRMADATLRLLEEGETDPWELGPMEHLTALPALALGFRDDRTAELVDNVVQAFCTMLIDIQRVYAVIPDKHWSADRIKRHMLLTSAWLRATGCLGSVRATLEGVLRETPIVVHDRSFSGIHQSRGYPSGPMGSEGWYLFFSPFWDNAVQAEVHRKLMGEEFLTSYSKDFVTRSEP